MPPFEKQPINCVCQKQSQSLSSGSLFHVGLKINRGQMVGKMENGLKLKKLMSSFKRQAKVISNHRIEKQYHFYVFCLLQYKFCTIKTENLKTKTENFPATFKNRKALCIALYSVFRGFVFPIFLTNKTKSHTFQ